MTAILLLASCAWKKDKVIPRGKLAEIYAEMLLVDQWIVSHPGSRQIADTSLVYEPVLERYGYTSSDYRRSVDVYMDDPERFSRILRTTVEIMDRKLKVLEERKAQIEHEEALKKLRESMKIKVEVDLDEMNPYLYSEPYVHYYDSLSVEPDSAWIYRFRNIDTGDTVFRDLRMVIPDTLQPCDSLYTEDTVRTADTPEVKDTISDNDGNKKNSGKIHLHTGIRRADQMRVSRI